jgi:hypothetical protein
MCRSTEIVPKNFVSEIIPSLNPFGNLACRLNERGQAQDELKIECSVANADAF